MLRLGIKYEGQPVPLEAHKSFWVTPKEEIDAMTGGCGPGWLGDWFVPDTIWGLSVKRACRIHDFDYYMGTLKGEADLRFLENMQRIIIACTRWSWLKELRLRRAQTYYLAVRYAGDSAYAKDGAYKEVNLL